MSKSSILAAIMLLVATAAHAEDDGIVRMRSDGLLIDPMGKIIAVPARDDSRNNEYNRYYKSLGPDGQPIAQSDFYIITDPLKGMVKVPVGQQAPKTYSSDGTQQQAEPEPTGMVRKYSGSQTLIKSPDAPIYNDVNNNVGTVY